MFGAFRALSHCFFLLLLAGGLSTAQARSLKAPAPPRTAPSSDWTPAEKWAWSKIEQGEAADFDKRPECRGAPAPDPKDEKNAGWRDDCRNIRARLLIGLLTQAPWREATPVAGVQIAHARIVGVIDHENAINLENATLVRAIWIRDSRIEGAINLMRAHTDSLIAVDNSLVTGDFNASSLRGESDLFLWHSSVFEKQVLLIDGKVAGQVAMIGASFRGALNADSLQVSGILAMRSEGQNKTSFKEVSLRGAKITGQVDLRGASFDGLLFADSLQVGEALLMRSEGENKASFNDVNLRGAKVTGQVDMRGASFNGLLFADSLQVGEALLMRSEGENKASFKDVNLCGAKVAGQVDMSGASFNGLLFAESLHVDGDLFLKDARAGGNVIFTFAHAGSIDLRGANLASINLTGASVGRDFIVGKLQQPSAWAILNLRNAHVGYLTDARDAWPEQGRLVLDGFAFDHLGAFKDDSTTQTRNLDMAWWDRWAKRDPDYSPAPYTQLAAALKNSGDNDAANEIRFLGRERAREAVCQRGMSFDCFFQNVLGYTVGYGIGRYTFFALGWVVVLSLFSMFVLKWSVPEAREERKTWLWCFGAGLSRLLPGVDLSKEFADFFDGPFRPSFTFLQGAWFYFIRFAGLVLGAAVIAAFAGLTQGP
jgi:uncharacterized protein YjbI with pentapeptide repeats